MTDNTNGKLSLVVFGHSHLDPIKGAGGIIAKYAAAGHQTTMVPMMWFPYKGIIEPENIVAPEGRFPTVNTPEEINTVLKQQAVEAANVVGASVEFLDYPPMRLSNLGDDEQAIGEIADLLRKVKADIVITHWPEDKHSGTYWHSSAGIAVSKAFFYSQRAILESQYPVDKTRPKCLLYYMPNQLTPMNDFRPDVYLDISDFAALKHTALTRFTHVGVPAPSILNESRMVHARYWGQVSGVRYAEVLKLPDARGNYQTALDWVPNEWLRRKSHTELSLPADFG
jgi:LmbE family N-acetylglucosaminyl deacetylase